MKCLWPSLLQKICPWKIPVFQSELTRLSGSEYRDLLLWKSLQPEQNLWNWNASVFPCNFTRKKRLQVWNKVLKAWHRSWDGWQGRDQFAALCFFRVFGSSNPARGRTISGKYMMLCSTNISSERTNTSGMEIKMHIICSCS